MLALDITREEIASGQMKPEHREAAVAALRRDGIVVLNDVIDTAHLDILRPKMLADAELLRNRKGAPFNFNANNLQQDPPPFPPYLFRDILLNAMVIAVTQGVLGRGLKNNFYSGNTALPGGQRQPVHVDMGQLWPDQEVAHPAFGLVVNVPVVDMSQENGSTEVWPGTHRDTTVCVQNIEKDADIRIPDALLEQRRQIAPPFQPTVRGGSVVIRDMRLWHAGMPNFTDTPRPMIALIHWVNWWPTGNPLRFPKGTEAFFQNSELTTCAEFVEGEIDYIHAPHAYDYQPEEPGQA